MKRSHLTISFLAGGLALIGSAPVAHAKPAKRTPIAAPSDFDLSRQSPDRATGRRYRLRSADEQRSFASGPAGPYWSYSPLSGGPKIEAAALGGGRKGAPKLAHVGLDWDF